MYVHDLVADENSYSMIDILPEGEYEYKSLVYTKRDKKEHLLIEVKTGVAIKSKGVHQF